MMISYKDLREKFVSNLIPADDLFDMLGIYYPFETYNGSIYRYYYNGIEITFDEYKENFVSFGEDKTYSADPEIELEEKLFEQCYLIDEQSARMLEKVSDEIIVHFIDFDLWFWCIEENNTPWGQLFTNVEL